MAEIPWEKVVESCGASFDCVRDIFVHSLQAEQSWIRRLSRKDAKVATEISWFKVFGTSFSKFADIKAIQKYAIEVETETNEYLKTLTDKKLQSIFEYKGFDGKTRQNKIEDILMHMIEEEIHHRGELLCIYWQNDINPPYATYIQYLDA
jgi:uncharacterized damage-inducible protein DinB